MEHLQITGGTRPETPRYHLRTTATGRVLYMLPRREVDEHPLFRWERGWGRYWELRRWRSWINIPVGVVLTLVALVSATLLPASFQPLGVAVFGVAIPILSWAIMVDLRVMERVQRARACGLLRDLVLAGTPPALAWYCLYRGLCPWDSSVGYRAAAVIGFTVFGACYNPVAALGLFVFSVMLFFLALHQGDREYYYFWGSPLFHFLRPMRAEEFVLRQFSSVSVFVVIPLGVALSRLLPIHLVGAGTVGIFLLTAYLQRDLLVMDYNFSAEELDEMLEAFSIGEDEEVERLGERARGRVLVLP